jgi:hypothetical protein
MNWYAYVHNDPVNMVDPTGTDYSYSIPGGTRYCSSAATDKDQTGVYTPAGDCYNDYSSLFSELDFSDQSQYGPLWNQPSGDSSPGGNSPGISNKGNPCSVGFGLDKIVGMKTFLPDGYWEFGGGLGVIAGVGGGATQSWGVKVSNGAIVNAYRATNIYGGAGFYGQAGIGAGWSQTGSYNASGTISAGGIAGLGPWGGAFTGSGPNLGSLSNWGQSHSLGKDGGGGVAGAVIITAGSCKVGQ